MKRIVLKKKPKKISLKRKPKFSAGVPKEIILFHENLDRQIILSENKNKKLGPIDLDKKYHYKERMPPNDPNIKVNAISSSFGKTALPAFVLLQHYIGMEYSNLTPLYPMWEVISNKPKLRRLK